MKEGITILHYNNNNASDVLRKSSLEGAYEEMKSTPLSAIYACCKSCAHQVSLQLADLGLLSRLDSASAIVLARTQNNEIQLSLRAIRISTTESETATPKSCGARLIASANKCTRTRSQSVCRQKFQIDARYVLSASELSSPVNRREN